MFPYIDNRKHAKFSDELRLQTLGVWNDAVHFFNRTALILKYFPENNPFEIKDRIQASALKVADTIAQASYAKSREIYEHLLSTAEEAISETVSSLYISEKWGYVQKGMYDQLFDEGGELREKLEELSERRSFSSGQLN